jgi:hypothetical protein
MIRLGIRIRNDIRRVLFNIRESEEYEDFSRIFVAVKNRPEYDLNEVEKRVFRLKKNKILARIGERTRLSLLHCISPHESKRKKGLYRKKAVAGYEKYARVLLKNVSQILPDIYSFVEIELNNSISYFRIHMRI